MSARRRHVVVGIAGASALATALAVLPAGPAAAHEGSGTGGNLLKADLIGSQPLGTARATPVIAGKRPGGAPWVTDDGSRVRVRRDGRIDVRLRGLLIPATDVLPARNPVPRVVAALVCADAVVAATPPFDLDAAGGGRTRAVLVVPARCDDPVVLIQPGSAASPAYIAFTAEDDD